MHSGPHLAPEALRSVQALQLSPIPQLQLLPLQLQPPPQPQPPLQPRLWQSQLLLGVQAGCAHRRSLWLRLQIQPAAPPAHQPASKMIRPQGQVTVGASWLQWPMMAAAPAAVAVAAAAAKMTRQMQAQARPLLHRSVAELVDCSRARAAAARQLPLLLPLLRPLLLLQLPPLLLL